jgi:hypothetical protein
MAGPIALLLAGRRPGNPSWGISVGRWPIDCADVLEAFLCPEDHALNDVPGLYKVNELSPPGMSYLRPHDDRMVNHSLTHHGIPPQLQPLYESLDGEVLVAGRVLETEWYLELRDSGESYVVLPRWGEDLPELPLSQLRERMPPCRLCIPANCSHLDITIQGLPMFGAYPGDYRLMYPRGLPLHGTGVTLMNGTYRLNNGEPKKLLEVEAP